MGVGPRSPEGWFLAAGLALVLALAPMALHRPPRWVVGEFLALDGERLYGLDLRSDGSFRLWRDLPLVEVPTADGQSSVSVTSFGGAEAETIAAGRWTEEDEVVTLVPERLPEEPPRLRRRDDHLVLDGFGLHLVFSAVGPR